MGWLGKDRSTVIKGAVDLVSNVRGMIDDKNFTAEERARVDSQIANAAGKFAIDTLGESTERSIARRSLAVNTVYFFYFLSLLLIILWKFDQEWFIAAKDLIVEFKLPVAFLMVMAFFFGGYYVSKFAGKDKKNGNS